MVVSATWGARCGKSARRVLRGGTGTRRHAGSVRPRSRKGPLRRGSAKATAPRPVPTSHTVRHHIVLEKVARRVCDDAVLWLLRVMLKASGRQGVPQGGVISPLLSNVYLNEVDRMLERAKAVTRYQRWTAVEYARFADDLVILVDSHPRQQWLRGAVEKRLREELAKLLVEVNEEKSRKVDLQEGESFGFLGFEFRRIRSHRGRWMPLHTPKGKKA